MKIFLGGTCNGTTWRDELIPKLEAMNVDYFNPVVEDWTPECQDEENRQKEIECGVHFYCITSDMIGVFSIAEIIDSAHTEGIDTIFLLRPDGFSAAQLKSLKAVGAMVLDLGGSFNIGDDNFKDTIELLDFLKEDAEMQCY